MPAFSKLRWFVAGLGLFWLAGCSSPKIASAPQVIVPLAVAVAVAEVVVEEKPVPTLVSSARTPKEYRHDAAKHIYGYNQHRIHKGKLPPLLYAIGVVTFEVREDGESSLLTGCANPNKRLK